MPAVILKKKDTKDQLIHIPLYFAMKTNKFGSSVMKFFEEKKAKEMIDKGDKEIQILNTKWRSQTWRMHSDIFSQSNSYNNLTGNSEFDIQKYNDNIYKNCLVEWDAVDSDGNPISITPQNLDEIPVDIVKELLRKYSQSLGFDEEEAKK